MKVKYNPALLLVFSCTAFIQLNNVSFAGTGEASETDHEKHSPDNIVAHPARVNFTGKWKLNKDKSETGQYGVGSKTCLNWMSASKTLGIATYVGYLTVDVVTSANDGTLISRQEKLNLDGKETEVALLGTIAKRSALSWSRDGQTMYICSATDYHGLKIKTSETWKLINGGNSILIQSNSNSGENIMKLVYDRVQ